MGSGKMPLHTIHEFFEACNTLMILPQTKKALREEYMATSQVPNKTVIEMQHSVLNKLGYATEFGVQCLNTISTDFPHDRTLRGRYEGFALSAQLACQHSTMEEEDVEAFYKQIPPLLKYTPHIFVSAQRAQQYRMMQ